MPAKDDYESFQKLAARVFGDGDDAAQDRDEYVDWHMERLGYKRQSFWEDNEDKESGSNNPFSKRRESRPVGPDQSKKKSGFGMGGGGQYRGA